MSKKNSPFYAGLKVGEKIYFENFKHGGDAFIYNDRAKATCWKYYSDNKITKTKNGVTLTKSKREFYQGVFAFLNNPQRLED